MNEIVSAYAPKPYVPGSKEPSELIKHNQPPDALGVLRRAMEIACLVNGVRLETVVFDADVVMVDRANRKRALVIPSDLAPYFNQGILPSGVEAEAATHLMPKLTEVYGVQSWEQFKRSAATKPRSELEAIFQRYEQARKKEAAH